MWIIDNFILEITTITSAKLLILIAVALFNLTGSSLRTLNTIFLSKEIIKPVYINVFIKSILAAWGVKIIAEGEGVLFSVAFALGDVLGVYVGNKIESKLAIGLYEITIFAKKEKAFLIADDLRGLGYTATTTKGYGYNGIERFRINLTIDRKEYCVLEELLVIYGYDETNKPTMYINEIKDTHGKISTSKIEIK